MGGWTDDFFAEDRKWEKKELEVSLREPSLKRDIEANMPGRNPKEFIDGYHCGYRRGYMRALGYALETLPELDIPDRQPPDENKIFAFETTARHA